jgi:hypothetical protein
MPTLTHQLKNTRLTNRIFNEDQLGEVLGGGDARRYGLVNRALKEGSLIRIRRGLYTLSPEFRSETVHPFAVAQALLPGSYISFETALAHHGWIPEAVYTTASTSPDRKTISYDAGALGRFTFHPMAVNDYQFLAGVRRLTFGKQTAFIASPLRALLDLVALRKQRWSGLLWLTQGLRVDIAELRALTGDAFSELEPVYKHRAVRTFLNALATEITSLQQAARETGR